VIGAILADILVLFFLCLLLFCFAYACGKYVSKFISILALMISNAGICYVSLSSGFQAKFIIIASLSGLTAICNFLGMVLPLCCVKLSHLYNNPDINNKLRVNHSQVEEPFVEKVYSVPQEILRDTITESSAPSVINPNQENDNNNKENIINLIESVNQEQNIIGVK